MEEQREKARRTRSTLAAEAPNERDRIFIYLARASRRGAAWRSYLISASKRPTVDREGSLAGSRPPLVTWSLIPTTVQSVWFIDLLWWNALIMCIPQEKNCGIYELTVLTGVVFDAVNTRRLAITLRLLLWIQPLHHDINLVKSCCSAAY